MVGVVVAGEGEKVADDLVGWDGMTGIGLCVVEPTVIDVGNVPATFDDDVCGEDTTLG